MAMANGADPQQWYGSLRPVPLYKVEAIDLMKDSGNWMRVDRTLTEQKESMPRSTRLR